MAGAVAARTGIEAHVIHPTSVAVSREHRRAKTDRLDTELLKRAFLGWLGRRLSPMQEAHGFPGNDWLAGITKPECVLDPEFFVRWLQAMPGGVVELMCHPGRLDPTLVGRDCTDSDGLAQQRVHELRWLRDPSFLDAVEEAGFRLIAPSEFLECSMPLPRCAQAG